MGRAACDIQLVASKNGKPTLVGEPELALSISHSGNAVAIAIAECNIGIDVEDQQTLQKVLPLARQFINDEAAVDIAAAADLALDRLTLYWTTLESLVKFQDSSIFKARRGFVLPALAPDNELSFNLAGQQFFSKAIADNFRMTLCSSLSARSCDFQQITPDNLDLLQSSMTAAA